ncbi:MAG: DUF4126 domain-containing protein [Microbacteriaceae bacterium]
MLEFLAGIGLATAAGLNAYIPLLTLGLAGRFLDFVTLPAGWAWLSNEWVLGILAVLLIIEFVADKVPAVDSVNDWIQTIIRPASGGIVFGTGVGTETNAITDPSTFFESNQWIPVVTGILIALAVHLAKMATRPILNAMTFGAAAPVASAAEDVSSIALTVLAIIAPILIVFALFGIIWLFVAIFRRASQKRAARLAISDTV